MKKICSFLLATLVLLYIHRGIENQNNQTQQIVESSAKPHPLTIQTQSELKPQLPQPLQNPHLTQDDSHSDVTDLNGLNQESTAVSLDEEYLPPVEVELAELQILWTNALEQKYEDMFFNKDEARELVLVREKYSRTFDELSIATGEATDLDQFNYIQDLFRQTGLQFDQEVEAVIGRQRFLELLQFRDGFNHDLDVSSNLRPRVQSFW